MNGERKKKLRYWKSSQREDNDNEIENMYSKFVDGNRYLASDGSATTVADESLQARVLKILKNAEEKLNIEDDTEFEFTQPSNMNNNVCGNESSGNISDHLADFNKYIRPLKRNREFGKDKYYYDDVATCKCGRPYDLRYRVYPGFDRRRNRGSRSTYFYAEPELLKKYGERLGGSLTETSNSSKRTKLKKRYCDKTSHSKETVMTTPTGRKIEVRYYVLAHHNNKNSHESPRRKREYSDDEQSVTGKNQYQDDSSSSFKTAQPHIDDESTKYGRVYDNTQSNRKEFHKHKHKTRKSMPQKNIEKYPDTDDSRPEIVIRDSATNKKRAIKCNSKEYHAFMKLLNK